MLLRHTAGTQVGDSTEHTETATHWTDTALTGTGHTDVSAIASVH